MISLVVLVGLVVSIDATSSFKILGGPTRTSGVFKNYIQAGGSAYTFSNWTGAVNEVSLAKNNPNLAYAACVSGGVWATANFRDVSPAWTHLNIKYDNDLGFQTRFSSATSSVYVDRQNANLVTVGSGHFSAYYGANTRLTGVAQSKNGGLTWYSLGFDNAENTNIHVVRTIGQVTLACASADPNKQKLNGPNPSDFINNAGLYVSGADGARFNREISGSCYDLVVSEGKAVFAIFDFGLARSTDGLKWETVVVGPRKANDVLVRGRLAIQHISNGILIAYRTSMDGPGEFIYWTDPYGNLGIYKTTSGFANYQGQGVQHNQGNTHGAIAAHPTQPYVVYFGATSFSEPYASLKETGPFVLFFVVGDIRYPTQFKLAVNNAGAVHPDARRFTTVGNDIIIACDAGVSFGQMPSNMGSVYFSTKSGNMNHWEAISMDYDPNTGYGMIATQDNSVLITRGAEAVTNANGDGGVAVIVRDNPAGIEFISGAQYMQNVIRSDALFSESSAEYFWPKNNFQPFYATYPSTNKLTNKVLFPTKTAIVWGSSTKLKYCQVYTWLTMATIGSPRLIYGHRDKMNGVWLTASNVIYELSGADVCSQPSATALSQCYCSTDVTASLPSDYSISAFCQDPASSNRFFALTYEGSAFLMDSRAQAKIIPLPRKTTVNSCQWVENGDVKLLILATSTGVYVAIDDTDTTSDLSWLQLEMGLESPDTEAMSVDFRSNTLSVAFLGTGAFVLENFWQAADHVLRFNTYSVEASGIQRFNEWDPPPSLGRQGRKTLTWTFAEDVELSYPFAVISWANFDSVYPETVANGNKVTLDVTDANFKESVVYSVVSAPHVVAAKNTPTVQIVGNNQEQNNLLSTLVVLSRFSVGPTSKSNVRAKAPMGLNLEATANPGELKVSWFFNQDTDLGGCYFARWEIFLTVTTGPVTSGSKQRIVQRIRPDVLENDWDPLQRYMNMPDLTVVNSYSAEIQVQCLDSANNSPLSAKSASAVPLSHPAAEPYAVTISGKGYTSIPVEWTPGPLYGCASAFEGWQVQLRKPGTEKEGYDVCLESRSTSRCTASGLSPGTDYGWARVRARCRDSALNSPWTYTETKWGSDAVTNSYPTPPTWPTNAPTSFPTTSPPSTSRPTTSTPTSTPTNPTSTPTFFTLPPTPETGDGQGFDFGTGCAAGKGRFTVTSEKPLITIEVGTIPAGKYGVIVNLTSANDLDIQLYDVGYTVKFPEGAAIVADCEDKIGGCNYGRLGPNALVQKSAYTRPDMDAALEVEYSGYNGVNFKAGHEYIKVFGKTTIETNMKAYTYVAGTAVVEYSWDKDTSPCCQGTAICNGEPFSKVLEINETAYIGEIPAGKIDVRIELKSPNDTDVQLRDKNGQVIIGYNTKPLGLLQGPDREEAVYEGVTYVYSGYNGEGGAKTGYEYIEVKGKTNRPLLMFAFGYTAGSAAVTYTWHEPRY